MHLTRVNPQVPGASDPVPQAVAEPMASAKSGQRLATSCQSRCHLWDQCLCLPRDQCPHHTRARPSDRQTRKADSCPSTGMAKAASLGGATSIRSHHLGTFNCCIKDYSRPQQKWSGGAGGRHDKLKGSFLEKLQSHAAYSVPCCWICGAVQQRCCNTEC